MTTYANPIAHINANKEFDMFALGKANALGMGGAIKFAAKAIDAEAAAKTLADELNVEDALRAIWFVQNSTATPELADLIAPVLVKAAKIYAEKFPEEF